MLEVEKTKFVKIIKNLVSRQRGALRNYFYKFPIKQSSRAKTVVELFYFWVIWTDLNPELALPEYGIVFDHWIKELQEHQQVNMYVLLLPPSQKNSEGGSRTTIQDTPVKKAIEWLLLSLR